MFIPDEDTLKALTDLNLSGGKSWSTFCNWLVTSYSAQVVMLIDLDEERQSSIFSGRCRELKELLLYINNAKVMLEESQQNKKGTIAPMTMDEAIAVID
jgi:hypothetical protein